MVFLETQLFIQEDSLTPLNVRKGISEIVKSINYKTFLNNRILFIQLSSITSNKLIKLSGINPILVELEFFLFKLTH